MDGHEDGDVLDPLDIFDTSLSSLFSVGPIAFSPDSKDGLYTYRPPVPLDAGQGNASANPPSSPQSITESGAANARPISSSGIKLRIPNPSAEVYSKLQANYIWLSAVYLADQISLGAISLGRRVAELGAGAGLPGIMAARLGCEVLSTDWGDEDILQCLKENFQRNCGRSVECTGEITSWAVMGHEWGTDPSRLLAYGKGGKFDTLILADTLWVSSAQGALLNSIQALLSPDGTAHIAAALHTGRCPITDFIRAAEARGAVVRKVREVKWKQDGDGRWDDYTAEEQDQGGAVEERGVVVHLELTWRIQATVSRPSFDHLNDG